MLPYPNTMLCSKFPYLTTSSHSSSSHIITSSLLNSSLLLITIMSSSSKSSHDYLQKHQRDILEPWRQSHNLPPLQPSPPLNRTLPTSPITTNSLSSPSPPQIATQNEIVHDLNELHHLSNLIDINLQQAIEATNPSPPTSPLVFPATLDQVNFHSEFCHCCLESRSLFDILTDDLNHIKSLIIGPSIQFPSSITTSSP
ncbi:hypothetical protein Tco_0044541 [Tanacetum coccineum]